MSEYYEEQRLLADFCHELDHLVHVGGSGVELPYSWEEEIIALKAIYGDDLVITNDRTLIIEMRPQLDLENLSHIYKVLENELHNAQKEYNNWFNSNTYYWRRRNHQEKEEFAKNNCKQRAILGEARLRFNWARNNLKNPNKTVEIHMDLPGQYPYQYPNWYFYRSGSLDGKDIGTVKNGVTVELYRQQMLGEPMIFNLLTIIQDYLNLIMTKKTSHEYFTVSKQVRLEAESYAEDVHFQKLSPTPMYEIDLNNPHRYVGKITDLVQGIDPDYRVTNVENILRADLAARFEGYRSYLVNKYLEGKDNRKQQWKKNLADIQVSYHGSYKKNMEGIVQNGLIVPGKFGVNVAHGSRYGNGIYTSPDINFSLHYSRGEGRLLVCATLPGRRYICNYNRYGDPNLVEGFDSHQSHDKTELILFKAAQVLPCYVIHYKYDPGHKSIGQNDLFIPGKESIREKRERLKIEAMNTLCNGFGPAGKSFIVEWVGMPREVEEDYGDFQNEIENEYQNLRAIF